MKVVILAGGKGTRMGTLTKKIPKPMVPIANKPILQYQIELARRYDLTEIIILTGYKGEVIENYFKDGSKWGVKIDYNREKELLGTAGALKEIEDKLQDDFLVFYGDIIMDVDIKSLISFHNKKRSIATIVVHPNEHPYDSDLVEIDKDDKVTAFHFKPHKEGEFYRNLVNAALFILSPNILKYIKKGSFSNIEKDIFSLLLRAGESIYTYNTPEYIKDIGTIDRLKEVEYDVNSSKLGRLSKINKRKAIFLDRDGVLNYEKRVIANVDDFKLLPEVEEAVRKINKSNYLAVVVTNQPVIAKGVTSPKELDRIHAKLETLLGEKRAYLDKIYYCPHHPEKGFDGEIKELKIDCDCRKPKIGMIKKASEELNIDIANSYIIGDRTVDIMTGKNAGLKTILVKTGYKGEDGKYKCEPDFIFENLKKAIDFLT